MKIAWLLFSFNGRVGRLPFWLFTLVSIAVIVGPALFVYGAGTAAADNFVNIASLLLLWPALAGQVKRWHDRDKSAWWLLINLVPIIGGLWALVENGFLPGSPSTNRYGTSPQNDQAGSG